MPTFDPRLVSKFLDFAVAKIQPRENEWTNPTSLKIHTSAHFELSQSLNEISRQRATPHSIYPNLFRFERIGRETI